MEDKDRNEELTGQGREDDVPPEGYGGLDEETLDEEDMAGRKRGSSPRSASELEPEEPTEGDAG